MRSSSLKALLNVGVRSPREFRDKLIHEWFLTLEETKYLDEHLLAAIPVEEFFPLIKNGEILYGKFIYQIVWVHKSGTVKQSGKAIVSFRFCRMLGCGYALVKKNNVAKDDIETVFKIVKPPRESAIAQLLKRS